MDYDQDKVDDATLALLYLTMWYDYNVLRTWKEHDWATVERLYQKGYLAEPTVKSRSIVITEKGRVKGEQLCRQLFSKTP